MSRRQFSFLILAASLGASAAYFVLYVEPRKDYLVELDFRRLAAMAERIDMQLATYRQVVAHAARPPHILPPPLEWLVPPPPAEQSARPPAKEPTVSIREEITPGGRWLLRFNAGPLVAGLPADELVQQAFERNAFDKLILTTSKGRILHQEGRSDIHLASLYGLGIEAKDIEQRSRATGLYEAELSGRSYKVFVQPCSEGWVLYALLSEPRFHWRSLQISINWLILFSGVTLLVLLALPFLKLLTLGPRARLRAIDGLLAGLCALIGLSILTVLFLDAFIYRGKLEGGEEGEISQVKQLAGQIKAGLDEEIKQALDNFLKLRQEASRSPRPFGRNANPPKALARHTSFFWTDKLGEQIFKWATDAQAAQPISVADRAYFRDALSKRYSYGRTDFEKRRVTLESVRSWTTGEDQLVLATLDRAGVALLDNREHPSAVAALATRLPSVHGAVFPPGFGFAVIDSTGKVLFHSDRRRMLQENFLDEADSPALSALAVSGRAGAEKISYLGRRHRVYLEPIPELAWSVIAFRDMTLLRATNVQIVTTTLACLVLYAALFLTLFSTVYVSTSTRARWLWPDASRHGTYLQLGLFYLGCLTVYIYLLSDGNPVFLLVDGMMIPLLVLFVSYVKVRSDQRLLDHKQVGAVATVALLLVISVLAGLPGLDPAGWLLALVSLVVSGLLLFLPVITRFFDRWRPVSLRLAYLCAAALLLMVLSVLPAASFFKLACDVPLENMIKHGQWTLMQQLEGPRQGKNYGEVFFRTRQSSPPKKTKNKAAKADLHLPQFLDYQEEIFPIYSEHSRILARLSPDSADGWPWRWTHSKKDLWLHRNPGPVRGPLDIVSSFPAVKPRGLAWSGLGAGILALGLMSFGLVWLMAHNLMLLGSNLPLWLDRRHLNLGTSVIHRVYVSQRPERLRIATRPYIEIIDLASAEADLESGRLLKRPIPTLKRLVVVKGFEHRIEEPAFNWAKLRLLETLIGHGARRVLLLSSQDPFLLLSAGFLVDRGDDLDREQEEQGRWRDLLARFAVVDLDGRVEDAKRLAEKLEKVGKRPLTKTGRLYLSLIEAECSPTSRLQEIGIELLSDLRFGETSRRGILSEILVRAEGYYTDLWASLPEEERLVLVQLAEEGLANPKNLRPLQRLIARGLVCCDPAPRLMNETLRLFVFTVAAKEDVRRIEAKHEEDSTWGQLKVPLTASLLGGIVFFGFTQQEMLTTTLSVITIATGAMPHLLQLVGYLGATKLPLPPVR